MKSKNSFGTSVGDCPPRSVRMTFRNYQIAETTCRNDTVHKVVNMLSEEDPERRLSPPPEDIRVPVVNSFGHE